MKDFEVPAEAQAWFAEADPGVLLTGGMLLFVCAMIFNVFDLIGDKLATFLMVTGIFAGIACVVKQSAPHLEWRTVLVGAGITEVFTITVMVIYSLTGRRK